MTHECLYVAKEQNKPHFSLLFQFYHWKKLTSGVVSLPVPTSDLRGNWNAALIFMLGEAKRHIAVPNSQTLNGSWSFHICLQRLKINVYNRFFTQGCFAKGFTVIQMSLIKLKMSMRRKKLQRERVLEKEERENRDKRRWDRRLSRRHSDIQMAR